MVLTASLVVATVAYIWTSRWIQFKCRSRYFLPCNDNCENDENKQWTETRANTIGLTYGQNEREYTDYRGIYIYINEIIGLCFVYCVKPVISPSITENNNRLKTMMMSITIRLYYRFYIIFVYKFTIIWCTKKFINYLKYTISQ